MQRKNIKTAADKPVDDISAYLAYMKSQCSKFNWVTRGYYSLGASIIGAVCGYAITNASNKYNNQNNKIDLGVMTGCSLGAFIGAILGRAHNRLDLITYDYRFREDYDHKVALKQINVGEDDAIHTFPNVTGPYFVGGWQGRFRRR